MGGCDLAAERYGAVTPGSDGCDMAEIAAPVQGTTKDAIVGEELRQHRRTVRTAVTAASLLFVLTIAAVIGALIALDQRDKAETEDGQERLTHGPTQLWSRTPRTSASGQLT